MPSRVLESCLQDGTSGERGGLAGGRACAGPALTQCLRGGCECEASPSPDMRDHEIPQGVDSLS